MTKFRILDQPKAIRLPLPKGKLNMRFRQLRGVYQIFTGSKYLDGASGDNPEEAALQLANQYDIPVGTPITVHGFKRPATITTPDPDL